MYKLNLLGGIKDDDPAALKRAKNADLLTLPKTVAGTNCFNCKYISRASQNVGHCVHPDVRQPVNDRMCCAYWSKNGVIRGWEK